MEGKNFIFVVLSGLCFLPACFLHKYIFVQKPKSWPDAQSYCRSKYSDLATVANEEDFDELMTTIQGFYDSQLWIGLYDDINSWRWSLQGYDGAGEAMFRMWGPGEPDNTGGFEDCAEMKPDGSWDDVTCNSTIASVCYNVASSSFIFVNEPMMWSEAQNYCREHYTDLASVRNQSENDQINQMAQNKPTWIGLHRDSWTWSDGSPVTFHMWNTAPKGNTPCVCLHQGHWDDEDCRQGFYFICHVVSVKKQLVRVKITKKSSSVNLENAAEGFLQQFRQTLKDHGLDEDMELTWRKQPGGEIFYLEEKKEERKEISCNLT